MDVHAPYDDRTAIAAPLKRHGGYSTASTAQRRAGADRRRTRRNVRGFIVERTGLSREWSVCLDSDKLLIFSLYNPGDECPHVGSPEFSDMVDRQDSFTWYADYPHEEAFDVSRWIEEVANPDSYYYQGFSIEADGQPR